ncbi:uncharacterized protein LOC121197360 [Toxotes jaculatrix]|uniref:uncharacterized protein LOC121197360 n=1 Tax=Toxotes jaculatrix TaxID=941984 RepID=UPI001B3AFB03|nr:uncharacterized protein LOC121197360 [Toxotes jaculatrix]
MHVAVFLAFSCGFVCGTSPAQDITCTVTAGLGHTTYSLLYVPEKFGTNCSQEEPLGEYSWAIENATGHSVIAHQEGQNDEVVRSKNISTLSTSKCFDRIIYKRGCILKDIHFTVNCTINCSENALAQKSSKDPVQPVEAPSSTTTPPRGSVDGTGIKLETLIIVAVVVAVLVLLVLAVVIYKRYIHKKIKHTRASYTPGRADEEEGEISLSAN